MFAAHFILVFPDVTMELSSSFATATRGGAEWVMRGTQTVDLPSVRARGQRMEVRGASILEPLLIGEIMRQSGAAEVIGGLRAEVALAEAAYFRRDFRPGFIVDFHGAVGKSVANPALSLLISSLVHATNDINTLYKGRQPDMEELIESHRRIVMLMAAGKEQEAREAMANHLRETSEFYAALEPEANGA
jgi:DNA-binding GntR family transcriptional regulator